MFQSAMRRLQNFVTTSVFESHVGGRFAANLVRAAAKVGIYELQHKKTNNMHRQKQRRRSAVQ